MGRFPRSKRSNWKWKSRRGSSPAAACKSDSNNSPTPTAGFFPHDGRRLHKPERRSRTLRGLCGEIKLTLHYGRDPRDRRWCCPLLEVWGVRAHQEFTPAARRRLAFTLSASGTYAEAAELATEWGLPVDDSTLHALAQSAGARAEEQTARRLATPAPEREPQRAPSALAVLMIDGCQLRYRGPGWGKTSPKEPRVAWHELKLGVFYREEQAVQTAGGRGLLSGKRMVSWRGEASELGRRLHWEAQADGLGRALRVRSVNDGAPWIWNLVSDRWSQAEQVLDFYHGSQHLHALGAALHGEGTAATQAWAVPRRKRLRRGNAAKLLKELGALEPPEGEAGAVVRREQNYFAHHAARMNYRDLSGTGPIGSGAVESACRQRQCRFKRAGQFWSDAGLKHLCALQEARRNGHWAELWNTHSQPR